MTFDLYCPNCNYDPNSIAPGTSLANTEPLACLTAHGLNPFTPESLDRASRTLAHDDQDVVSTDPLESRLTFTANGHSITLVLDEEVSVIAVTRSETGETA
ncbi:hypothetical protein ACFQE8_22075 [Salinirubellus sp. GCM10025818]|uniref:DUF7351 domain-containing protein n=1 Tax=Salinirubellus TaxID=2162630 RepID=UPI0030D029C5